MMRLAMIMVSVCVWLAGAEWTPDRIARERAMQQEKPTFQRAKDLAILGEETPRSYQELVEKIDAVLVQYPERATIAAKCGGAEYYALYYACWHAGKRYIKEGYASAKKLNNGAFMYRFVRNYKEQLGVSDVDAYNVMLACLLNDKSPLLPGDYTRALDYFFSLAVNLDEKQVYADLRKLNKVYTSKLLQDKERWETVVVAIRTAMNVYQL